MPKAKEVFKSLGLEDADIEKLLSSDEKIEVDDKAIVASIIETQKTIMEGDGTFEAIRSQVRGESLTVRDNRLRAEAKKRGVEVTQAEYDALPKANRSDALSELILKRIEEKLKTPSSDPEKDKEIERLQAALSEKEGKIKEYEEVIVPGAQTEAENKIAQFRKEAALRSTFQKVNAGKLVADENILWPGIQAKFNDLYDTIEENGVIVPVKKGTTNKEFKDGKAVGLEHVFDQLSADIRKKSDPVPPRKIPEPGQNDKPLPAGLNRAQKLKEQRLQEMEAHKK